MSKVLKQVYGILMAVILVSGCLVMTGIETLAAETVTVSGKIKSGTTNEMIYLDADGSEMKIKIDENTDLSNCKLLLEGAKVKIDVYHGSDKYLHAAKIVTDGSVASTVTTGSTVIISGNVKSGTTTELLKITSILGDFDIKMDTATDVSGCKYIAVGRNILITCGKDTAGKLYAIKVEDGTNVKPSSSSSSAQSTATISGKIDSSSNTSVLYLNNETGKITVKLDSDTQVPKGVVLVKDSTVTVTVYTGSDNSLHAQKIVQSRTSNTSAVDTSKLYKISGKVADGSTTDMIKFDMGDGSVMNLKLDDNTQCTDGIILTKDTKVTVTCGRGADAYMHAVKIDKAN